ncbi:MAG: hypothetical protein IPN42_11930 [Methylococcaceae bacterium]|nr:hypothetical protein [Methylococcaceae bacterium]
MDGWVVSKEATLRCIRPNDLAKYISNKYADSLMSTAMGIAGRGASLDFEKVCDMTQSLCHITHFFKLFDLNQEERSGTENILKVIDIHR